MLLRRIQNLDEGTLARKIYQEGKTNNWPGLGKEVSDICEIIGIPDVNFENVSTKTIKDAIFKHHYSEMKETITSYKKIEEIKDDDFKEPQKYMHFKSANTGRLAFKIRVKMVENIPANFKGKFKNNSDGLICKHCTSGDILSQSHCLICPGWLEIRQGLDMEKLEDLTTFFTRLLLERAKMDAKMTMA